MKGGEKTASASSGEPPDSEAVPLTTVALTFSELAIATGIHRSSIRRRFSKGEFPNAYRKGAGPWRIPVTDLPGAGIELPLPADNPPNALRDNPGQAIQRLRERLAEMTRRAEVAETTLRIREEQVLDLRRSLHMLEPGRPEDVSEEGPSVLWPVASSIVAIHPRQEIGSRPDPLDRPATAEQTSATVRTLRWPWQRRAEVTGRREARKRLPEWLSKAVRPAGEIIGILLVLTISLGIGTAYALLGGLGAIVAFYIAFPGPGKGGLRLFPTRVAGRAKGKTRWDFGLVKGRPRQVVVRLAGATSVALILIVLGIVGQQKGPENVTGGLRGSLGIQQTRHEAGGGNLIIVPVVRGLSAVGARAKLVLAGLEMDKPIPTEGPPGEVVGTRPAAGQLVAPGTLVTLFVGVTAERLSDEERCSACSRS